MPNSPAVADPLELLVLATAAGDQVAYDRLYADLGPRVLALATRILHDAGFAQDVAQEVLAEVWRTASCFDRRRGTAIGWVLMMTHHRAVDRVRHEAASRRRDAAYGSRNGSVSFDETAVSGAARLESSAVRAALDALSQPQRQAIELTYFHGRTQAEVALAIGVPLGTVKSRIRDGLVRMRTALPDLEPEAA